MAVSVGDDVAAGEELAQALVPPVRRASIVNEADADAFELDGRPDGQRPAKLAVVHVPLYGDHRAETLQVDENRARREIARVDDGVRGFEDPEAGRRERTRAAREMRVSQKRDQKRSGRNSPFR